MGLVIGGHLHRKSEAVPQACLVQKGLGLFQIRVVRPFQTVVVIGLHHRAEIGVQLGGIAAEHTVHNLVLVHGVADGLAHPHVVKRRLGIVQRQNLHHVLGSVDNVKLTLQHLGVVGLNGGHIQTARLQRRHHRRRIRHNVDLRPVNAGHFFLVVIVRVLFQHHPLGRGVLHKPERSRPHRMGGLLLVSFRQNRLDVQGQKRRGGLLQMDHKGVLIRRFHALYHGEVTGKRLLPVQSRQAVVGVDSVLRRKFLSVVEPHPFPQEKGVGQAVGSHLPPLCQTGDNSPRLVERAQPFKHIVENRLCIRGGRLPRVQAVRLRANIHAHHSRVRLPSGGCFPLAAASCKNNRQQTERQHQAKHSFFHRVRSPSVLCMVHALFQPLWVVCPDLLAYFHVSALPPPLSKKGRKTAAAVKSW